MIAVARVPAHRTQSSRGRDARDFQHGHRVSQHARRASPLRRDAGRDFARSRSRDVRRRQVASGADGGMHRGGTVAQLAAATRIRSLLRISAGGDRSVLSRADLRQSLHRYARHRRRGLSRVRGPRRSLDRFHSRRQVIGSRAAVLPLPGFRRDSFAASVAAQLSREISRTVRRRLGCGARRMVRPAKAIRNRAQRHAPRAAQSGGQAVVAAIGKERLFAARLQEAFAAMLGITPMRRLGGSSRFSKSSTCSTTRFSS